MAQPLHIAIVSQYFWPENFRINDVAEALVANGHTVTVVTGQPNYPGGAFFDGYGPFRPMRETYAGATVLRFPIVPRGRATARRLLINYASFALTATLSPARFSRRPNVVLVFQVSPLTQVVPALALKATFRSPIAMWVQDLWPQTLNAFGRPRSALGARVIGTLADLAHRSCDRLLVQSRAFEPILIARGLDPTRVSYVPNWGDDKHPSEPCEHRPSDLPQDGFTAVFAGNMGQSQSLHTLLNAAELIGTNDGAPIHFALIGDGREREALEREAVRRDLRNVHFLGAKPAADMPRYFAAADCLLLSLRRDEIYELTVPSKLQSYLAAGRPIIGAVAGEAARVILDSSAGIAVEPDNPEALATAMKAMASTSALERNDMATHGRAYSAAEFSKDAILKQIENYLLDLAVTA